MGEVRPHPFPLRRRGKEGLQDGRDVRLRPARLQLVGSGFSAHRLWAGGSALPHPSSAGCEIAPPGARPQTGVESGSQLRRGLVGPPTLAPNIQCATNILVISTIITDPELPSTGD